MTGEQIPPAPSGLKASVQQNLGFYSVEDEKSVCKFHHTTNCGNMVNTKKHVALWRPELEEKTKKKSSRCFKLDNHPEHHNKAANPVRKAEVNPCFAKDLRATSTVMLHALDVLDSDKSPLHVSCD